MALIDIIIVVGFLILTFFVGSFFYKWVGEPDDFYVAGRQLTPFILAAVITATNVNLYSFVGQAGIAYKNGISILWQTWTGNMALVFSGLFIIPVMRRLRVRTIPEFLSLRYNRSVRLLVGVLWVFRLAFWLGVVLYTAVVAAQAIPVIAIAPLVILWAGSGLTAKMLVAALTLFFPTLVNTMVGIRSVERDLLDLMRALNASRWQVFYKLELPASLPILFGGLKIGVALAVIGAVVGEFVAADQGLGFLINLTSRGTLDTALLFVALGVLVVIAVTMYTTVGWLERHLLRWQG